MKVVTLSEAKSLSVVDTSIVKLGVPAGTARVEWDRKFTHMLNLLALSEMTGDPSPSLRLRMN